MPTASTASMAASTLPGPIGRPAARSVRAKYMTLARSWPATAAPLLCRGELLLHLGEQALRLRALDLGDVVLVFEQHAQRVVDRLGRQRQHVELRERMGPVDGLGDARQLEELVRRAQLLHE